MKIYFAHSIKDYNSKYETECFEKILKSMSLRNITDFEIVNPKNFVPKTDMKYSEDMKKVFFPLVKKCDIVYAFVESGNVSSFADGYSKGVFDEINYAKENKIRVVELNKIRKFRNRNEIKIFQPNVIRFLLDFFDVKDATRCRVRHFKGQNSPYYYSDKKNATFETFNKWNSVNEIQRGMSHFLVHLFNDSVLKEPMNKSLIYSKINGIQPVIDIDSPTNNKSPSKDRFSFFDYADDFIDTSKLVSDLLDDLDENYNIMFSGNGLYFILEAKVLDDELSPIIVDDYLKLLNDELESVKCKVKNINLENSKAGWNRYYKLPFIQHFNKERISMPLNKNWYDDIELLKQLSDINNLKRIGDIRENTETIINNCKWDRIW